MSVKWEKLEGNKGILTIEVDAETVKGGLDEAFKKVSKEVSVPGFRKGRIPRGMFESALVLNHYTRMRLISFCQKHTQMR